MRDYALETTFDLKFTTRRFTTGVPFALAGTPVVSAYPDNSVTQLTAGITLTPDFDGVVGLNNVRVVATAANGYAAGSNYSLVITTGTVDSVSVVGEVVGDFSLEAQSPLRPLVNGRELDVTAGNKVQGVVLTDTLTTYTGNTLQTGDSFARLGAPAGASVSADLAAIEAQTDDIGAAGAGLTAVPWNAAWDAEVQSEVDDALVARNLHSLISAAGTADSGSTTTMVDAARTEGDADYWKGQRLVFTSGTLAGQVGIVTDFNAGTDTFTFAPATTQAVSTHTYVLLPSVSVWDDTLAEHLGAGTTGFALNAAGSAGDPWGTALPGAYGAGTAGAKLGRVPDIAAGGAGGLFIAGTNAATVITTALTANVTGNLSGSVGSVTGAVGSVTAGVTLAASAVQAIWDALTSALTVAGSIGKRLADFVTGDAFVRVGAPAGASVSADIAAVQADTNDLQTRVPASLIGGRIDADVEAVNASTDAADRLQRSAEGIVLGTVGAASTTTSIVTSSLDPAAAVTDQYKGRIVTFKRDTTTVNLRGQSTDITANTAAGVLTVTALTTAPVSGDTFTIN